MFLPSPDKRSSLITRALPYAAANSPRWKYSARILSIHKSGAKKKKWFNIKAVYPEIVYRLLDTMFKFVSAWMTLGKAKSCWKFNSFRIIQIKNSIHFWPFKIYDFRLKFRRLGFICFHSNIGGREKRSL